MNPPSSPEKKRAPREKRGAQLVTITQKRYPRPGIRARAFECKRRAMLLKLAEAKQRALKKAACRNRQKATGSKGGNHPS